MTDIVKQSKSVVIYINPYAHTVRLTLEGEGPGAFAEFFEEEYPESFTACGDYSAAVDHALTEIYKKAQIPPVGATVIIPARLLTVDYITIPTIKRGKIGDAFETEYKILYHHHEKLYKAETMVASNRINSTFRLTVVKKEFIDGIKEVTAKYKLVSRDFVPEPCAVADAAYMLHPQLKKTACIIADVRRSDTLITVCGKDVLLGSYSLPFGWEFLTGEVVDETELYTHDSADLVLLNARERAKAMKLTTFDDININSKKPRDDNSPPPPEEEFSDEETLNFDEETDEEPEEREVRPAQPKKVKSKRKLPAYMLRDLPESEEGVILENFRNIQKRILLIERQCELSGYLPKIETVCLNLPKEFEMIASKLNADTEHNKLHWMNLPVKSNPKISSVGLYQFTAREMKNNSRFPVF